jgi:NAD(P)-dependent dehydrogenase (short-subunit alcohol dehydrogenase family)
MEVGAEEGRWFRGCRIINQEHAMHDTAIEPGQTAVITGAAGGIGLGLAKHAAGLGMHLALADIDAEKLAAAAQMLAGRDIRVTTHAVDVRDEQQVAGFAAEVFAVHKAPTLLFNNAGILNFGRIWENSYAAWKRVIDVNLNGVAHGLMAFVPRFLAQKRAAHIVNTASVGGLMSAPLIASYIASKYAVVGLTESLRTELEALQAPVGVSLLCPGPVSTDIFRSARRTREADWSEQDNREFLQLQEFTEGGVDPLRIAELTFAAIAAGRFWIFPHPEFKAEIERRHGLMMAERNPGAADPA